MEIKKRYNILRLFFILTFVLSAVDSYSVGPFQKPSLKAAMDSFSKNDYEKAYGEFTTLLQSYPKDPLYKYYSGVCLVKMIRDPEHASSLLQDALNGSLDIKDIPDDAWFYLGRSQQMQGRFREAIDSYNSFEREAGKKAARGFDLTTYIQECNAGKGRIQGPEETKIITVQEAIPLAIPPSQGKDSQIETDKPLVKPVPQKQDVPPEYDILLSEAMNYQIKADSVNRMVAEYKNDYNNLPASEKESAKLKISEMESLASEYQRMADNKFSIADNQSPEGKNDNVIPFSSPEVKKGNEVYSLFKLETNPALAGGLKIFVDPEIPAGLIYRIQIGVFSKPPDVSYFKGISPVVGFKVPGTAATKYLAGMFRKIADANMALLTDKQAGFKDAFVTAFLEGKAISFDRALLLENEWGLKPLIITDQTPDSGETDPVTLSYRVELTRSIKPVSKETLDNYKKMSGNRGIEIISTEEGTLVYLIGKFITFESASEYADLLKRNGYRESHVVAYLGNKEIPIETAKQLFLK